MSNVIIIGKSLDRLLEKLAITTEDEIGFLHHDPESRVWRRIQRFTISSTILHNQGNMMAAVFKYSNKKLSTDCLRNVHIMLN
jgi:hypothetical protein